MNACNYAGIEAYDINNGKGFGVTLFIQGCPHHCHGCHNPSTWDNSGGMPLTENVVGKLLLIADNPNIRRLTLSGGEPLTHQTVTYTVASRFKSAHPDKQLWVYTGYVWEELYKIHGIDAILPLVDVLVDGPYIDEQRDITLPFRGSANQRVIDVQRSLKLGMPVIYPLD